MAHFLANEIPPDTPSFPGKMIDLSDIENRESEIGMKDPNVRNHHFIGVGVNPQETFDRKMEPLGTSSPEKQDGSPDYLTVDEQDCSSDSIATSEVNRRQESKSVDGDTPGAPDPEGARGARGGEMGQSGQRPVRQPLLRAIHLELSQLAAEADGVSEKVKVMSPTFFHQVTTTVHPLAVADGLA